VGPNSLNFLDFLFSAQPSLFHHGALGFPPFRRVPSVPWCTNLMDQRLFRVYFSTAPHVPAHSYRHVWAKDIDHAKSLVNEALQQNRAVLDTLDFYLGSIQEERINLFSTYLHDASSRTGTD